MGFALPNGARVYVQKTAGLVAPFTAISNAASAVATLESGHGLVAGDIVLISSGWTKLDSAVAKVTESDATTVTLGNIKTTSTDLFPTGEGAGSLTKIVDFERLPQITEVSNDGGEQQYLQIQFLEDDKERSLPTIKSAKTQSFTFAHDSSLAIYEVLQGHNDTSDIVVLYMYVPKAKEYRYWSAKVSFDPTPVTTINEVETVSVSLTVESPAITFYKS